MKESTDGLLRVLIYVDDILVSGPKALIAWLKDNLEVSFKIKSTKDVEKYVGLDITRKQNHIELGHQSKILDTVKSWELNEAKPRQYPITPSDTDDIEEERMPDIKKYQSIVGSLGYISRGSRPDIAYAVNYLARRTQEASSRLLKIAKNVLVYVRDTIEQRIILYRNDRKENTITMYVDASFASEKKRQSVYGFLIYLNDNLICYRSKKLPMIVLSSTEAEYVGICKAVQE